MAKPMAMAIAASMRLLGRSRKQQKATPINHMLKKLV